MSVLVALVAARIALPYGIEWYVNRTLDQDPDYDGRIDDVDVYLLFGRYRIQDVDIVRTQGGSSVPFFQAEAVDIALEWRALLDGAVVGQLDLVRPVLNFAVTDTGEVQDGSQGDWRQMVLDLFPVQVNRLRVVDGEVHYLDAYASPPVDLVLDDIDAEVRNLTNSTKRSETLVADFDVTARAMRSGRVNVVGALDPFAEAPTFDLDFALRGLDVTEVNPWLDAYAKFDVERGSLHAYAELVSADGAFRGYLKPLLRGVEVRDGPEGDPPLEVAWELTVGAVKDLLSNRKADQVATVAPLEGRYDQPRVAFWRTVGAALGNAFIEVLRPGFEAGPEPVTPRERKAAAVVEDEPPVADEGPGADRRRDRRARRELADQAP